MTSRIFLNLRSAALDPLSNSRAQSTTDFPLGSRRAAVPEFVRATGSRVPTASNMDTTLLPIASSAEGNALGIPEELLSRGAPGPKTKPGEDNPVDK